ncbi:hypothetical protein ACQCSX_04490 [Pseudarthrobacter sp. P1]|uniref:hypothetical protein n=1 Tax=Pseudarthrobacter sp. P1 TaxID=3418418 RepID=UPI003CF5CA12
MSALQDMMRSSNRTPQGGSNQVPALWRGTVTLVQDGRAWVLIPRLLGNAEAGPLPCVGPAPSVGASVIIGAIEGRLDDLIVLAAT